MTAVTVFLLEPGRVDSVSWLPLLSGDERARHGRFKHPADQACFLAAHGLLRSVLSRRVPTIAPRDWRFELGPHGKPTLQNIHFNLSHCRELVAVALAERDVGVDVEPVDARHATADVAARVYGPRELADLAAQPTESMRVDRFFTRWVIKESWVKATGIGIHDALPSFEVELGEGVARAADWRFAFFSPRPAIKLGVCVESPTPLQVTLEEWS